jgi:lysophospholipase L1-like esterase
MKILICGDSTAASYSPERAPLRGWGQALAEYLPKDVPVVNAAMAGRSTKSFLSEGRLQALEGDMDPGDLLLIQFTHNDMSGLVWRHTDPWTSFQNNLSIFVTTARDLGARPVLMTPICRRYWRDGKLLESHGEYPDAIRVLAAQRNVPLIDIYEKSTALVRELGDEESRKLYLYAEPGVYPAYPNGSTDDTHTQRAGAETYARMTADALKEFGLI